MLYSLSLRSRSCGLNRCSNPLHKFQASRESNPWPGVTRRRRCWRWPSLRWPATAITRSQRVLLDENGQVHARVDQAEDVIGSRRREGAKHNGIVIDHHIMDGRRARLGARLLLVTGAPTPVGEDVRRG